MKTEVKTFEEVEKIVEPLQQKQKYVIDVLELPMGAGYEVQWIEQKKYTDHSGIERMDEAWVTEQGDMKMVQDLEPEHVRNILRMVIRQTRETQSIIENLMSKVEQDEQHNDINDDDFKNLEVGNHTIH